MITVFWDVMTCSVAEIYRRFEETGNIYKTMWLVTVVRTSVLAFIIIIFISLLLLLLLLVSYNMIYADPGGRAV
jgi:hypothetical protein